MSHLPLDQTWTEASRSLINLDRLKAQARMDDGQKLSGRQWAALIWAETDIPTAPWAALLKKSDTPKTIYSGKRAIVYSFSRGEQFIDYYPVSLIADPKNGWHETVGTGAMEAWVDLLEDDESRIMAYNVAHGVYASEGGPGVQLAVNAFKRTWKEMHPEGKEVPGFFINLITKISRKRQERGESGVWLDDPFGEGQS